MAVVRDEAVLELNRNNEKVIGAQLEATQSSFAAGAATNMAATLEIDAVIDPAQTRGWLIRGIQAARTAPAGARLAIDTW